LKGYHSTTPSEATVSTNLEEFSKIGTTAGYTQYTALSRSLLTDSYLDTKACYVSSRIIRISRHVSDYVKLVLSRLLGHIVFGYGPLENSILSRSLDRVKKVIKNVGSLDYDCPKSGLYPLDFALGWPDGLQWLLEAGYKPEGTLELSIFVGDIESTRILLEADGFALAKFSAILYIASCSDKSDMHSLVVDSLKKKAGQVFDILLWNIFLPTMRTVQVYWRRKYWIVEPLRCGTSWFACR
jgi:hypothetical protein